MTDAGNHPAVPGAVLICAATRWEAGPLAALLGLKAGDGLSEGTVAGRRVLLLKTGMGSDRTRAALGSLSLEALPQVSLVLSAGLACGLDPALRAGHLVADITTGLPSWEPAVRRAAALLGLSLRVGSVARASSVLSPADKAALFSGTGACAADMETSAVREWAADKGLAMLCARVILDAHDEEVPADLPDPDDLLALAGSVLERPGRLPLLMRLGLRKRGCLRGLASFLKELLGRV